MSACDLNPHEQWVLRHAEYFAAFAFAGRGHRAKVRCATRHEARQAAQQLAAASPRGRALVYAIYRTHDALTDQITAGEQLAASTQTQENQMAKRKSSKKQAAPATAEAAAPPAAAAPAPKPPRTLKTDGVVYQIKTIVLGKPDITQDDLIAALKQAGFKKVSTATVASFRSDFVHSLRFLKAKGYDIPGVA